MAIIFARKAQPEEPVVEAQPGLRVEWGNNYGVVLNAEGKVVAQGSPALVERVLATGPF
jgi:hypothetical protein